MHCMRDTQIRYMTTGLLLTAVLFSGCSMISGYQSMHQSAKGSVYLEEVSEWSFEANHPTIIDQNTMLKIVKGASKPCLVYKVLAAGREVLTERGIRAAFKFALDRMKPDDAMIVGMFQQLGNQVSMNARIVRELCQA